MELPGSVFISPRNRVAQLYPRALGSLYVISYDSQDYGGGILTLPQSGGPDLSTYIFRNRTVQSKVKVTIRPTVSRSRSYFTADSQSVCLGGTCVQMLLPVGMLLSESCGLALGAEVEVTLRLTISHSVCLGVRHPFGTMTRFYFFLSFAGKLLCYSFWGALPDERTGL
jgi:hypothetical protein